MVKKQENKEQEKYNLKSLSRFIKKKEELDEEFRSKKISEETWVEERRKMFRILLRR